ncbi:oligopeptide transport ATP-binding protein OppF [Athalassotoga saccharophila]|nr:dipeptide ABC transporter ATP-binding protein [Athalassotoga saccharophila]BBJ27961.1 oligopeptide transport ATP-binding protein OppF [Athalassotoga saccharophila]
MTLAEVKSIQTTQNQSKNDQILLEVKNLKKYFPIKAGVFRSTVGWVKAVDDVSFYIKKGETLGLVGESGCGKTTVGQTILRLIEPTGGHVFYNNVDLFKLSKGQMKKYRSKLQMIFQDPYSSLDPRMRVKDIIAEGLKAAHIGNTKERYEKVRDYMQRVGVSPTYMNRFPHEFSGGQRQRIGIARALVLNPELIVADEAVSALDASVQAQVLNLLDDLQQEFHLTYLFIAHNLSVVRHVSDRVVVMYLGKVVEIANKHEIFSDPLHPYTKALLSANPIPDPTVKRKDRIILQGDVPSPANPPSGCRFHTRCWLAQPICAQEEPKLEEVHPGHFVACHFWKNLEDQNK